MPFSRTPPKPKFPEPPEPNRVRPKFCKVCGEPLLQSTDVAEYDTQTGEPVELNHLLYCPYYKEMWGVGIYLAVTAPDVRHTFDIVTWRTDN